jgi:hypothetical protein
MILFSVCRRWFEVFCFYITSLVIISQMELALLISDMLVKDNLNYKKMANYYSKLKTMLKLWWFFSQIIFKNIVKEGKCNKNEDNLGIIYWWLCDLLLNTLVNQSSVNPHFDFNYRWTMKMNCKIRLGTP